MSISFVALAFIFGELFLMASKRFETEIRVKLSQRGHSNLGQFWKFPNGTVQLSSYRHKDNLQRLN